MVISDTHGNYPLAVRAFDLAAGIDCVIHLGDGADDAALVAQITGIEVILVAGNCDPGSNAPRELVWECEGKRLLLTHGDRYGVKSGLSKLEQRGIEAGAEVVLFGHTHCATITSRCDILFVNPGNLMSQGRGATYAILEITADGITANLCHITS
jgi:putative phosphoesterase